MCLPADSRYVNFYGQKGARLTNDQTIYDNQPKRTYLIKTLSVFFFYAPELHLRGMHGLHILRLYTETPFDRVGICLYGFRHLSAPMVALYHKAAVRLDRIHPLCKCSPLLALRRDLPVRIYRGLCC